MIDDYPETVVYSHEIDHWIHNPHGLYTVDAKTGWATDCGSLISPVFRHFNANLQDAGNAKCCTPNVDCRSCRLYAQAWASLLQRFPEFVRTRDGLENWVSHWELWSNLFLNTTEPHLNSQGVCNE